MSDAITLIQAEPRHFVGVRRKVPVTELAGYFAEVLPKVMGWMQAHDIEPASMPMAMWCAMDPKTGIADCHAGCFTHEEVEGEGEITSGQTSGGDLLTLTHVGSYAEMGKSWQSVYARAGELGRAPGAGWEIYVDDPQTTDPASMRTEIYLPVA